MEVGFGKIGSNRGLGKLGPPIISGHSRFKIRQLRVQMADQTRFCYWVRKGVLEAVASKADDFTPAQVI